MLDYGKSKQISDTYKGLLRCMCFVHEIMWCASCTQNPSLGLTKAFWAASYPYVWVFCINIMKAGSFCQTETSLCYYPPHALFSLFWADYHCQWHMILLIYCKLNLNSHMSQLFKWKRGKKGVYKENANVEMQHRWNFTGCICQSQEVTGSRFSVNTLGPSPDSTSRPMRVESVTTVGFSIVNISLTRRPASLGDCPAFSLPRWSCCSN